MKTSASLLTLLATAVAAGCASGPQLRGAVVPIQGGAHQSVVTGPDNTTALRAFDDDAKATCGTQGVVKALNKPGKYSVVSQNTVTKGAEKIASSDDKKLDAGISVGLRYLGLESKDKVEVTTVFKCE